MSSNPQSWGYHLSSQIEETVMVNFLFMITIPAELIICFADKGSVKNFLEEPPQNSAGFNSTVILTFT